MDDIRVKIVLREKRILLLMLLVILSVFIFPNQIRRGILGDKIGSVNLISSLIIIFLIASNLKKINNNYLFMLIMFSMYFIGTGIFYQKSIHILVFSYISFILPLFLLLIKFDTRIFLRFFKQLINIINIIIIFITIFGIVDFFMNNIIANILANIIGGRYLELVQLQNNRAVFRMYSFMGHPLFNTQLYIMFYVLNMIYIRYIDKTISKIFIIVITIVGISLTASKTGFILLALCLILILDYKAKVRYYLALVIGGGIILKSGLLNNIVTRFMTETLTTGRTEIGEVVNRYHIFPIKFFVGYGTEFTFEYNNYISWASAAFEYPFKMFQLELGTFNTLIIYLIIAVYPILILIKRRHYHLFVGVLIVLLDINTYNGLALIGDNMLIYIIFIFVILNLSNSLDKIENNKKIFSVSGGEHENLFYY